MNYTPDITNTNVDIIYVNPSDIYPIMPDLATLANVLGVEYKTLTWLVSTYRVAKLDGIECKNEKEFLSWMKDEELKKDVKYIKKIQYRKNDLYKEYFIPKRRPGEFRRIVDPDPRLKYVQKRLSEVIFSKYPLPDYITGFRESMSIRETSSVHAGSDLVISLDIHDYFPTIRQWQLQALFQTMGMPGACKITSGNVAHAVSEICTYHTRLPQGSPCSPILSNIIAATTFCPGVYDIATKWGFKFTQYADDLTFSTSDENIVKKVGAADDFIKEVTEEVRRHGFVINRDKTKIMRSHRRQLVLGQVVNERPTLPREKYYALKAIVYNTLHNGIEAEAQKTSRTPRQFISWIRGHLAYLKQIDEMKWEKLDLDFRSAIEIHKRGVSDKGESVPVSKDSPLNIDQRVEDPGQKCIQK